MKTAIMFSGQGAQYPGMMRDIFEAYPAAKEIFQKATEILQRDIYALSMNSGKEELNLTQNTQPCLLACELAALRVFKNCGIPYEAAFGFSLGEWAALVAAGTAQEEDVLRIIETRADAMQRAVPPDEGGMVAVLGKDAQFVSQLCAAIGGLTPANYNCPGNITVAGTTAAIQALMKRAEEEKLMVNQVAVSIPSHCALMEPAVEELRPVIQALPMGKPQVELVMNATGCPASGIGEIKENLIRQLSNPVMFQQSVEYLLERGFDTFVEIGPGKVLSGMVKRTAKQAKKKVNILQFNSLEGVEAVKELSQTV